MAEYSYRTDFIVKCQNYTRTDNNPFVLARLATFSLDAPTESYVHLRGK